MGTVWRGIGHWGVIALAAVMTLFGVPIVLGGAWLIVLGGSWYYALAGFGLLVSAWFLFRRSILGAWFYLGTFLGTLVWAVWEAGFNGWAQVPRLVAPSIILLLVLLAIPALNRDRGRVRGAIVTSAVGLAALASTGLMLNLSDPGDAVAQEEEQPQISVEPADPAPPDNAGDAPADDTSPIQTAPSSIGPTGVPVRAASAMRETGADWPAYGGTHFGTRHSPLDQITPDNVGTLERVWEFNTGVMPPDPKPENQRWSPENTPLKIGDDLFICTPTNVVIAIDARSGLEEWRYDPGISPDVLAIGACRGVAFFENPDADPHDLCARRIIAGTEDGRLMALDADMGQLCPEFGDGGQLSVEDGLGDTVPRWIGLTSAPTIIRGIAVVGYNVNDNEDEDAPSGVVRGYDAVTGELVWAWDLGNPSNRGEPAEGEVYTRGTPNMWTTAAADEELGLVYLPLGNSAVDYFGSNRSEAENEYATSLVAVDVTTGDDVWHFQTVYNDVWDYDLGSQPALVDFPVEGGTVPAVLVSSKQGDIYVLDRETGEPLFAPEEREVPQGGVEPDYLSPVQPFSTYHSLAMDPIEERDMWGMTPLDQLWCRIQFRQASYEGMYTPPTTDWYIQYPGYNGGQDWGSMAVDEERGILVVNYNDVPNRLRLVEREEAEEAGISTAIYEDGVGGDAQIGAPYAIDINVGWRSDLTKLMCKQPPYGGLRAIDLATGETIWDQPFGSARRNGPFNIPSMLPFTIGTPNNGGPIVTASGLIFIAATTDDMIRAYSIETGEELWSDELPAGGQATPIVYEADGTQYLAMMAGGHTPMETKLGDAVIAWALTDSASAEQAEQSGGE